MKLRIISSKMQAMFISIVLTICLQLAPNLSVSGLTANQSVLGLELQGKLVPLSQTICGFIPPAGNVPVLYYRDTSCSGSGINATKYQLPVSDLTICGFSVPANFAPVFYSARSECSTSGQIGIINSTKIKTPSSGLTICGLTAPTGFVPVVYNSTQGCSTNGVLGETNATIIRVPSSGLIMCGFNVPPGFKIVNKTYNSDCNINGIISNPNASQIQSTLITPTSTATNTPSSTPTTSEPTSTATSTSSPTPTTSAPTSTATSTPSSTPTTSEPTSTATSTSSSTPTTSAPTFTATSTPSSTPTTSDPTPTATSTPSSTPTNSVPTSTSTSTPSPTPTINPVPSTKVDLFAHADEFWIKPDVPHVGDDVEISLMVHMQNGRKVLQNVRVAFYLQTQSSQIGEGFVPFIDPPNQSETTLPVHVQLPSAGTMTLIAVIDPDDEIDEGEVGETNNMITRTIQIVPAAADQTGPVITRILLENGANSTKNQTIQAEMAVTDPPPSPSGVNAVCLIEYTYNLTELRWEPVKMSGWLPYHTPLLISNWQLQPKPGMHYIQVRAVDNAQNISVGNARSLINYIPESDTIAKGETRIYRQEVKAGQTLEVIVEPLSGDPDLYVWSSRIDQSAWVSNGEGSSTEIVRIPASQVAPGLYQVEVYGFSDAEYRLQMNISDPSSVRAAQPQDIMGNRSDKSLPTNPIVPISDTPPENGPFTFPLPAKSYVFLPFLSR